MMGLGKQGERFITNLFHMVQPELPSQHRAVLSLSWMQYEKLKVGFCLVSSHLVKISHNDMFVFVCV